MDNIPGKPFSEPRMGRTVKVEGKTILETVKEMSDGQLKHAYKRGDHNALGEKLSRLGY